MKYKKGIGMQLLIELVILAIVTFLLYSFFISPFGNMITSSGKSSSCSLSLIGGKGTANCPVKEVKISSDNVQIGTEKFMDKGELGTQVMVKEAIARLLSSCLSTGGGYNSRAFSGENYFPAEVVCLECFKIGIDESVGSIEGITDYLRDTKPKSQITEKKYLELLTRDPQHLKSYMEYGMARKLAPSTGIFVFKPNKDYTVFFMGIKKGEIPSVLKDIKDFVTLDFMEFIRTNDVYFVYAVESHRVQEVCDRKVN